MQVRDLMTTRVITLSDRDVLVTADELMGVRRFRHLPVLGPDKKLVGVLTRRDILAASLPPTASKREQLLHKAKLKVSDILRKRVISVHPDTDLGDAADLMIKEKVGCLPVTDEEGQVVGILTEADFVALVGRLVRHADETDAPWLAALAATLRAERPT